LPIANRRSVGNAFSGCLELFAKPAESQLPPLLDQSRILKFGSQVRFESIDPLNQGRWERTTSTPNPFKLLELRPELLRSFFGHRSQTERFLSFVRIVPTELPRITPILFRDTRHRFTSTK
jgi:hypothetical protein